MDFSARLTAACSTSERSWNVAPATLAAAPNGRRDARWMRVSPVPDVNDRLEASASSSCGPGNRTLLDGVRNRLPTFGSRNVFVGGAGLEPASVALRGRCVTWTPTSRGTSEDRTLPAWLKRPPLRHGANVPFLPALVRVSSCPPVVGHGGVEPLARGNRFTAGLQQSRRYHTPKCRRAVSVSRDGPLQSLARS